MKLGHSLISYTKINSKWLTELNIRHDTLKLLEKNTGKAFFAINPDNIFLDQSSKAKAIKQINKWDLIQLKRFCTTKETINKRKRQPTDWEKVIANNYQHVLNFQNPEPFCSGLQPQSSLCSVWLPRLHAGLFQTLPAPHLKGFRVPRDAV